MPGDNFKSITMNEKIYEKLELSSEKVHYLLKKNLEEKENLKIFVSKIKKYPETVRVYTNPWMPKKSGE